MHKGRVISGFLKHRVINFPDVPTTRPTSDALKESLFNCLLHRFNVNFSKWTTIDAFAGSGALGIEAVSLGSPFALFFEQNPVAYHTICENVLSLKIFDKVVVLQADIIKYRMQPLLSKFGRNILILMDPPYDKTSLAVDLFHKIQELLKGYELIVTIETNNDLQELLPTHVLLASGDKKIFIFHTAT